MQIINDRIQFVADDFAGLSAAAKAALIPYCGTNPFHDLLSDVANSHVLTAKRAEWVNAQSEELAPLVKNFARATVAGKEAAVAALVPVVADLEVAKEIAIDISPVAEELGK